MAVFSAMSVTHDLFGKVVVTGDTLPAKIGDWTGEDVPLTQAELSMLESPASSQRVYTDTSGDRVQVLVLQVNNTQNAHDPKLCMMGSGYKTTEDKVVPAPWSQKGQGDQVSRAVFHKNTEDLTMYYWLQTPGGTIADMSGEFKLKGILRALTGSTIRGIAVRVISMPNANNGQMTDPTVAVSLWNSLANQIHFQKLVSGIQ
jgi:EpsI family protein